MAKKTDTRKEGGTYIRLGPDRMLRLKHHVHKQNGLAIVTGPDNKINQNSFICRAVDALLDEEEE